VFHIDRYSFRHQNLFLSPIIHPFKYTVLTSERQSVAMTSISYFFLLAVEFLLNIKSELERNKFVYFIEQWSFMFPDVNPSFIHLWKRKLFLLQLLNQLLNFHG
jgi:hypothetical protein